MAVLTIRIPDEEMTWLDAVAKTQGTTKTQIVRSALRPVFEDNFIDKKQIILPHDQFQALVELSGSPLSTEELEGRRRLKNLPGWDL